MSTLVLGSCRYKYPLLTPFLKHKEIQTTGRTRVKTDSIAEADNELQSLYVGIVKRDSTLDISDISNIVLRLKK